MPSRPAVLLASSRSRGNTSALVEVAFPPGAVTIYDIGSMGIGYYSYDEQNATDAFIPLARRLLAHNSWVLATPLYWYTMSAQVKTFIDRLSDLTTTHRALGRQLSGKSLSVICSYILAIHPSADIGNCEHRSNNRSSGNGAEQDYSACYKQYSAGSATWAAEVHSADVSVGSCELRAVPVTMYASNGEWLLWWIPLPHAGGLPRRYFEFVISIDSRTCAAVGSESRGVE